jgi:hypothetical protein
MDGYAEPESQGKAFVFTCELSNDTLSEMPASSILHYGSWALTALLEVYLFAWLIRQKRYLSHPALFRYILVAILQSAALAITYHHFGEDSEPSYKVAWGSQALVICVRWLAVIEIARRTLAKYSGIWALVIRIFLVLTACVFVYAILSSGSTWNLAILNADRAVELSVAAIIVCMFLFIRYYGIDMGRFERMVAIGFCLYSCFAVINDSFLENWIQTAGILWKYLDTLAFLATVALWIDAVRTSPAMSHADVPRAVEAASYEELSQKLNSRLHLLNNRLNRLFRSEDSQL